MANAAATTYRNAELMDRSAFDRRVREEAETLNGVIRDGTLDNPQAIVGLEHEFYGATVFPDRDGAQTAYEKGQAGTLQRVPRWLLTLIGFEKELGLHNAEMTTSPQPLNFHGLAAQRRELQARLTAAMAKTRAEGIRLVADGMWTMPPPGESVQQYLTDYAEVNGVIIGTNVSNNVRYHGFANEYAGRFELDAPGVSLTAEHAGIESLTTSIQPHYQVPTAVDLPAHFRYAIRVAAPLLALGVNSPLVPPGLYEDPDPVRLLEVAPAEHRIPTFESSLNPRDAQRKVRFPRDVDTVTDAVDRLADDPPAVPMAVEPTGRFDDDWRHLRHKHGTFWRWIRPVFEGATEAAAHARIEFRPLPGQPTLRDTLAFQAAFAGLMESLPRREHPVARLEWETARDNFYRVVNDGLSARVEWITDDGERVNDLATAIEACLQYAHDGLTLRNVSSYEAERLLRPLRARLRLRTTPADWKRDRVRERLDEGADFRSAVFEMQREYVRRQSRTLIAGTFAEWLR